MALLKNVGLTGSAAGSLLLIMMFFRGITPNVVPQKERSTSKAISAVKTGASQSTKQKNKKWPDEGPWQASRQHFAGYQPDDACPSLTAEPGKQNVATFSGVDLNLQSSSDAGAK